MVLQSRASSGPTCLVFLWLCLVMAPDGITQAQAHRSGALSPWQQTGTKKCSQEKGTRGGREHLSLCLDCEGSLLPNSWPAL